MPVFLWCNFCSVAPSFLALYRGALYTQNPCHKALPPSQAVCCSIFVGQDEDELLKGPLYYCLVLVVATLVCWRDNPAGEAMSRCVLFFVFEEMIADSVATAELHSHIRSCE